MVTITQPDNVVMTVPASSVEWVLPANADAFQRWSVTAVFTPTQAGAHKAVIAVAAPYAARIPQQFWVEA